MGDFGEILVTAGFIAGIGGLVGYSIGHGAATPKHSVITEPYVLEEKITTNYVKPSEMQAPQWRDVDGDGKLETTMKINGKDYLFRFTGQGTPTLSLYNITPTDSQK